MLCAGKCTQVQVLPDSNTAGQNHMACKLLHSTKQAAFVLFYRVLEGGGKGALLTPGALEWTLIPEIKMGEEKSMVWTLPGTITCNRFVLSYHDAIPRRCPHQLLCPLYSLASIRAWPNPPLVTCPPGLLARYHHVTVLRSHIRMPSQHGPMP